MAASDRLPRLLASVLAGLAAAAVVLLAGPASGADPAPGSISIGPQAMEGNLKVNPGTTLAVGYDFTIPRQHPDTTVSFRDGSVTFQATCQPGAGQTTIVVALPDATYTDPHGSSAWYPSGDQHSPSVYQGTSAVPNLCGGGKVRLQKGGTFRATVESSDTSHKVNVRWHYSANNSSGRWSKKRSLGGGGTSVPVELTAPVVSGVTIEGQTLTATTGTWSNTPTSYSYQWQDCDGTGSGCSNAAGSPSTQPTYTLVGGDVGHSIRVEVTATNGAGSSAPAQSVGSAAPSYNLSGGTPTVLSAPAPSWRARFDGNWGGTGTEGCNTSSRATHGFWGFDGNPKGQIAGWGLTFQNPYFGFTSGTSSANPAFAGQAADLLVNPSASDPSEYGQRSNLYLCPVDPSQTNGVYTSSDSGAYEGSDAWYRMEIYLGADYTPDGNSGWNYLAEFHNYPNDYGVCCAEVALGVVSDTQDGGPAIGYDTSPYGRLSLRILGGGSPANPVADNANMVDPSVSSTYPNGHTTWFKGPNIVRNHWYDVLLHIKWGYESSGGNAGSVTYWLDGTQMASYSGSNLFYAAHTSDNNASLGPGVTNAYLMAANYRAGCQNGDSAGNGYSSITGTCPNGVPVNTSTSQVFVDEWAWGPTAASVGG